MQQPTGLTAHLKSMYPLGLQLWFMKTSGRSMCRCLPDITHQHNLSSTQSCLDHQSSDIEAIAISTELNKQTFVDLDGLEVSLVVHHAAHGGHHLAGCKVARRVAALHKEDTNDDLHCAIGRSLVKQEQA